MTATGCILSKKDRRIALALGAAFIAALTALLAVPSVLADSPTYDGEFDLYGYKITMGLVEPDQVDTVEWDFGDGSSIETVKITSDNPVGKVKHTYSAKGDYAVTATMRNQYTDSTGQLVDGESKLTYLYHIHGYPVITFDSNGGSSVGSIEGTASKYVAERPADPSKDGFGFSGWYTDKACTKAFDWTSEVTEHITLYAGWDAKFFTVSFDLAGGKGNISAQRIADGKTISAPAAPTKSGFEFVGWFLGDDSFDFDSPITSDITLQAHWKEASGSDDDGDDGDKDSASCIWIVFAFLAIVSMVALVFSGIVVLGFPAVLFAILAIVTFVLYGGVL